MHLACNFSRFYILFGIQCWSRSSAAGADPEFLERGFICIKGWGSFADFIWFFLNTPWKWNNLVLLRPNYFIFVGYLKAGTGRGFDPTPWTPSGSVTELAFDLDHSHCFSSRLWIHIENDFSPQHWLGIRKWYIDIG